MAKAMKNQTLLFALAVLAQLFILAAIPAQKIYTRTTGKVITIKTAPVDPYDFLSGYHVILTYEISAIPEAYKHLVPENGSTRVYAVLVPDENGVWQIDSVHSGRPGEIPDAAVMLTGELDSAGRITYGIEHYYIPETQTEEINRELRQNQEQAFADIMVDRFGSAALLRLKIAGKVYEY